MNDKRTNESYIDYFKKILKDNNMHITGIRGRASLDQLIDSTTICQPTRFTIEFDIEKAEGGKNE